MGEKLYSYDVACDLGMCVVIALSNGRNQSHSNGNSLGDTLSGQLTSGHYTAPQIPYLRICWGSLDALPGLPIHGGLAQEVLQT
jgi:hypothetical protein